MKLGVRLHDIAQGTIDEAILACKKYGFEYIQLVFKKALKDENGNPILFNKEKGEIIGQKLKEANINVSMLGAYFNPVHSNKTLVKENIAYFEEHLKYAKLLNCNYVGTETGSYNDDKWTYNPKNQTEEGYQESMQAFRYLSKVAEKYDTNILIEPAYGHVIYSVNQLDRAVKELNSKNVFVTIDIFNLLYIGNYFNYKNIFEEACKTFKDKIKVFHLKDFYVSNDKLVQTALGKGVIDFSFIIKTIKKYSPEATMIFEGISDQDMNLCLTLVKQLDI